MTSPRVTGYCPMGCGPTLFLGNGDRVTCSYIRCPDPGAVDEILSNQETEHIVTFGLSDFTIVHPLRERLTDMSTCELHRWVTSLQGPPAKPGKYRAVASAGTWRFHEQRT